MSKTDEPLLIEPAIVADVFATGMLPPEDRGGHIRVTYYADRTSGAGTERVLVARVVFSREDFLAALSRAVESTMELGALRDMTGMAH